MTTVQRKRSVLRTSCDRRRLRPVNPDVNRHFTLGFGDVSYNDLADEHEIVVLGKVPRCLLVCYDVAEVIVKDINHLIVHDI